jgi:hypothetical protein
MEKLSFFFLHIHVIYSADHTIDYVNTNTNEGRKANLCFITKEHSVLGFRNCAQPTGELVHNKTHAF